MALLTVQHTSGSAGLTPSFAAATSGGDSYTNSGLETLQVKNGSGGALRVTITAQHPCSQGTLHTVTYSVAAGGTMLLGPFAFQYYNDASNKVQITYPDGVTSLTVAVTAA